MVKWLVTTLSFISLWKMPCFFLFSHLHAIWMAFFLATTFGSSIPLKLPTLTSPKSLDRATNACTGTLDALGFAIDLLGFTNLFFTCAPRPTTYLHAFIAIMFYFRKITQVYADEHVKMQGLSHNWSYNQLHFQIPLKSRLQMQA